MSEVRKESSDTESTTISLIAMLVCMFVVNWNDIIKLLINILRHAQYV